MSEADTEVRTVVEIPERGSRPVRFLRLRRHEELVADPNFYFQLSRLIGMCEMLTMYMQVHGDEKAQQMARRADPNLGFFFDRTQK